MGVLRAITATKCGSGISKSGGCLEARYEEDPEREQGSRDTVEARVQQYSRTLAVGTTDH